MTPTAKPEIIGSRRIHGPTCNTVLAKHLEPFAVRDEFGFRQCFPWELLHALHLLDDILLMDNTGCYKTELTDRVGAAFWSGIV